jgi:hypothetical protein
MSRPILARKDTKSAESAQRRAVIARDGKGCRFERLQNEGWFECPRIGTDCAHIYRRRLCGRAEFHVDVAIRACRECHNRYDKREGGVRVNPAREAQAYRTIVANSKVPPPRQTPEGVRA